MDISNITIHLSIVPTILYLTLAAFVPTVLCIYALLKIAPLRKKNQLLLGKLAETTSYVEQTRKEFKELEEKHAKLGEFQSTLKEAEITTELQKSRITNQFSVSNSSTPEKYSYIHSLIQQGMSAKEIGSVLEISEHEAEQLINLSKIAKR